MVVQRRFCIMNMDITYRQEGGYLLPELNVPEAPKIGVWGERRRQFLREHRHGIYSGLLLSGKLNSHLEEIDHSAERMFSQLVKCLAEKESVTEILKAADQMGWVRAMSSIRNRAEEVVLSELIYY